MAVFRCKMCGGNLPMTEGASSCTCEFCGTEQTIPTVKDENLQGLFNRANVLRMKSEFDKAEEIYERILQSSESEAEAYWGLILCKYGIEYVEDPTTFKRIPTCHRTSYDAITADEDYRNALKYADVVQRGIYESEAKAIDEIQKGILAISQKEDPYDVFICYKETDENGKRTQDSVIANDIYYQLTQEGFKVFYAAITLEDKIGSEYEPYIFSALNTAKVMLSLGTKPEYFSAVWVKNEWSRFLKLMKKDRSKMLIPCYRDMDAYELPEEFAHLQAQDMSKIGFINDLVRGIKKVVTKDDKTTSVKETVVVNGGSTSATQLLKRAFMFLEDGDWNKADDFCEQVLNIEPENAIAYMGKLMVEQRVRTREALANCRRPFNNSNYYQKAYRFGDASVQDELSGYIKLINDRRTEEDYQSAKDDMNGADSEEEYIKAAWLFSALGTYKDSSTLERKCRELAIEAQYCVALKAMNSATTEQQYLEAAELFRNMGEYKDSKNKIYECEQLALGVRYDEAERKMNSARSEEEYKQVAILFKNINGYSDSSDMERKCLSLAEDARKEKIYLEACSGLSSNDIFRIENAEKEFDKIRDWEDSILKAEECRKKVALIKKNASAAKRKRTLIITFSSVAVISIIIAVIVVSSITKQNKYASALEAFNSGNYIEAKGLFEELGDYEESRDYLFKSTIATAKKGDVITFGSFEQDNNSSNGKEPIEWSVLDSQDGQIMIISNYVLIGYDMGNDNTYPTWADCGVRSWLNGSFMSSFSSSESGYIIETTVLNDKGGDTKDKAFILSVNELEKYYPDRWDRNVDVTAWAKAHGGHHGLTYWWLRSRCKYGDDEFTGVVCTTGLYYGHHSSDSGLGVRPVMWIGID